MTPDERKQALDEIATEVRGCTRCPLHVGRTNAVPGEGHPDTEVLFVGEGPGYNEDREGRPFVGAAGGVLNELLSTIGWKRDEVFITNVVKCRPPGNRDPEPAEIAACAPYLRRQLEVLDPALVVTLGRYSLQTFMPGARIGGAHGTLRPVDPATGARAAMSYAMYHPAAALRQGSLRETMTVDMCAVPDSLTDARARRAAPAIGEAERAEAAAAAVEQRSGTESAPEAPEPEPEQEAAIHGLPERVGEELPELLAVASVTAGAAESDDQMELFG